MLTRRDIEEMVAEGMRMVAKEEVQAAMAPVRDDLDKLQVAATSQEEIIKHLSENLSASDSRAEQLSTRITELQAEQTEQFRTSSASHEKTVTDMGSILRNDMACMATMQQNLSSQFQQMMSQLGASLKLPPSEALAGARPLSPSLIDSQSDEKRSRVE